jgi:periplasmic protein TonB
MSERRPVPAPSFRMEAGRQKRPWGAFALSVAVHVVVIAAAILDFTTGPTTFDDVDLRTPGGPGPAGGGGGGGAPRVMYVDLVYYQQPAARQEEPRPTVEELVIPEVIVAQAELPVDTVQFQIRRDTTPIGGPVLGQGPGTGGGPGAGTGTGGGIGSGRGTGIGSGVGPGTGGDGGEIFPPAPRYTILPPEPRPGSVKGKTYQARITVGPDGRVLGVEIRPEIRDSDYRRRLVAQLYEWAFAPAVTREGVPVKGETVILITL